MKVILVNDDIIVAIATSRLEAAISIIRLSGKNVIDFVNKIFTGNLLNKKSHTINYGFIIEDNKKIDEVLINIYKAPKTFTGEDMVEINCHGGIYITNKILEICLKNGARLAEKGEFSKRAFLNERIDLSQAEAISDMVSAKNEIASQLALRAIQGTVSRLIHHLNEQLIQIITHIEVNIDYPEYEDIEELTANTLLPKAEQLYQDINRILENAKNAQLIKEGIKTVIVGKPNVGKSSLLNALLEEDKAIVTSIAGTTRDTIEGYIQLDGMTLNLIDTAGIRETNDVVEKIGVERSFKAISNADLVLLVVDGSMPLEDLDYQLLEETKESNRIILINKKDKGNIINIEGIEISAKEGNINGLKAEIKNRFNFGELKINEETYISNIRHIILIEKAKKSLKKAIDAMELMMPTDLIVIDLYTTWSQLKQILGEEAKEDFLDELFNRFCIGK